MCVHDTYLGTQHVCMEVRGQRWSWFSLSLLCDSWGSNSYQAGLYSKCLYLLSLLTGLILRALKKIHPGRNTTSAVRCLPHDHSFFLCMINFNKDIAGTALPIPCLYFIINVASSGFCKCPVYLVWKEQLYYVFPLEIHSYQ